MFGTRRRPSTIQMGSVLLGEPGARIGGFCAIWGDYQQYGSNGV